ncbi:MAG: c-type cytochrome [Chloroflexota bacterium]|jgi:mono/diheme cytochrome c family protein/plastocyanin
MERREVAAWVAVGLIVIGLPSAVLGYQHWLRLAAAEQRVIDIQAYAPERGGFAPDAIRVAVNEPVTLRFAAMDVTHGVALGPGLGIDLGHVDPGKVKEISLGFDRPGTYTYYCNTWCGPDHWRMRGTIQVIDPANPDLLPTAQPDPVIAALIAEGVDIDAQHDAGRRHGDAPALIIERPPSAQRGATLFGNVTIPPEVSDPAWRRSHPPAHVLELLRQTNRQAPQADLIDVVAYLWTTDTAPETLAAAESLYNKNCAACHGQTGGGDGPAAGTTAEKPVAFADAAYLFERRSDVLYAKIRRGGMGTDMPNFGTLFTPEETWALVEYLWTLPVSALPEPR